MRRAPAECSRSWEAPLPHRTPDGVGDARWLRVCGLYFINVLGVAERNARSASIIAHMFTRRRKWFRLFWGIAFFTIPGSLSNLVVAIAAAQSNDEQNGAATSGNGPANSGQTNAGQASGGETLSSTEVSSLPLNTRDFSKLLLLAAGTMTDTNGAANFTQQFAVNGQRGTATVFAMDGFDTTDAELGGATFSNFNVDAIQEVQANAGVTPAEIGHGAASYTNVVTKSGVNQVHGSVFEFVRNAAFDARNYFDHAVAGGRRIPPFVRNEFGFTNGGPVVLPKIYDGRSRTFYFGQYQGFRQVLGTTQVFPVPTVAERQGIHTLTFPDGQTDTLTVRVNPVITPVLAGYPLPNHP